jgi:hypothetical protein
MILSLGISFIQQLIDNLTVKIEEKQIDLDDIVEGDATPEQIENIRLQLKNSTGIETETLNTDTAIAAKFEGLDPDFIPCIQDNLNLRSSMNFVKYVESRNVENLEGKNLADIPEF